MSYSPSLIQIRNLRVTLGTHEVLKDVNVDIKAGETVAILGANGSGKTTLVRSLLGILTPTSGSVEIFGATQRSTIPWKRIGYVPQRVTAPSGVPATCLEVVRSGLLSAGHLWADRGRHAKKRALEALDAVGLLDRANSHVQSLSGGQSQRVLIARALVRQPELLVLDEPLAGIDKDSREKLASILTQIHEQGTTLITVLHDMGELRNLMKRAIVVDNGRISSDTSLSPSPGSPLPEACAHHNHSQPGTAQPHSTDRNPCDS